jgi:predicted regulator of Ras-like GTPase activity (Roadblock/LC7/MglB family)
MNIDIGKLTSEGNAFLESHVKQMNLEGAVIATSEGLEMASYFATDVDADIMSADAAALLATATGALEDLAKGDFSEMIISASDGYITIKDLGDDMALAILTSKNYKMGALTIALKKFVKDIENF